MIVAAPPFKNDAAPLNEHFQYEEQDDKAMVIIPYGLMALSGFIVGLTIGLLIGYGSSK